MTAQVQQIIAEMDDELAHSRYVVEVSVEAFKAWRDRLASLLPEAECPCCPMEVRNLHAVAHNIVVQPGRPGWLDDLRRAVEMMQPLMDRHFASRAHSHPQRDEQRAPLSGSPQMEGEDVALRQVRAIPSLAYIDGERVSMSEADFEKLRIAAAEGAAAPRVVDGDFVLVPVGLDSRLEDAYDSVMFKHFGENAPLLHAPAWDALIAEAKQLFGAQAASGTAIECECCGGVGTIDETLGGIATSNPAAKCPDCHGLGEIQQAASGTGGGVDYGVHVFNCRRCPVSVTSRWLEPECPECGDPCELSPTGKP
jgi:ssDNA-binding Zn-finger/Zn-ribbon topoisomerase 1